MERIQANLWPEETIPAGQGVGPSVRRWWPAIVGLIVVWGVPVWHLSTDWSLSDQYSYGWIVPLLMLYLVRLRLADAPAPSLGWKEDRQRAAIALGVLIFFYFPLIVIRVANPDWRPLGYIIAGQAIVITWIGLYLAAGWRVAWHFSFPLLFFLVAVPWPRPIDAPVMHYLMEKNAGIAIEGLLWDGIAAMRRGNLVVLPTGTVGVDEACSGIYSLQGTLMLSIFLGEMYRLGATRRLMLLLGGVGVALATNAVRTYWLAAVAATHGLEAVEGWHDSAGYSILAVNFCALWLATVGLTRLPSRKWLMAGDLSERIYRHSGDDTRRWFVPTGRWFASLTAVVIVGFVFSAWWFARGEAHAEAPLSWQLQQPASYPGFSAKRMSDKVAMTLRHDSGWTGSWKGSHGERVQAWYLRWAPGKNSPQLASMHDPRTCLSGLGLEMQAELASWEFRQDALALPVKTFRFRDGTETVHVYYALLDDRPSTKMERRYDNTVFSRLELAWEGIRNRGQRLVEVGVWGNLSEEDARKEVEKFLKSYTSVQPKA